MKITDREHDIERVLYSREQIEARVEEIGTFLSEKYAGQRPVMVCVLKGASFFYIDLCRSMKCHLDMDFIAVSSYGAGTKTSGNVRMIKDLGVDIKDRPVVLVEDIIDTGLTLKYLNELFASRSPKSLMTVTFLKKEGITNQAFTEDLCGFTIPNEFVVGYGLDYAGYYRNLPFIGVLKPECYKD